MIGLFLSSILFFCPCFCRQLPILDPKNPEFTWMDALIEQDFAHVNQTITMKDYNDTIALHKSNELIVRFRIINNRIEGPKGTCFSLLEHLCETYGLPDLDFLYWNQDGPGHSLAGNAPILVGARAVGAKNTLLFTDWYFDIKAPSGSWNSEIETIDTHSPLIPWDVKDNKLFWRGTGSDTWSAGPYSVENWANHARGKACFLSQQFPDFIDAAFVGFHDFLCIGGKREIERLKKLVPMSPYVSIAEHLKYKYQLQITGLMANFPRDKWQFYSDCVVFRHPHPHEMYWYSLIKPWEHYIPIESSMNDLISKVKWARLHDEECHKMAKAARHFAQTHFMPEHIALYCYKVLLRYAKAQAF